MSSMNSDVYIGIWLLCEQSTVPVKTPVVCCPNDEHHQNPAGAKFCGLCGGKLQESVGVVQKNVSLHDVLCSTEGEQKYIPSEKDQQYLNKMFMIMDPETCDVPDGYDVVLIEGQYQCVCDVDSGCFEINMHEYDVALARAHADWLKTTFGYKSVEVKMGFIIDTY